MFRSVLGQVWAAAAVAEPPVTVVVFTGMGLVFLILLLLIAVVQVEGGIFTAVNKRQENAKQEKREEGQSGGAGTVGDVPAALPPAGQTGVSPQVAAVIMAAVTAAEEGDNTAGAMTLRVAQTAKKQRGPWGLAGVTQGTEPF